MEQNYSVELQELIKVFDQREVIKNFNLKVPTGSIYGLLGVNGVGKTTIFKMLTGMMKPTSGSVKIFGKDMRNYKDEILRNIGSLIEVPIFYEHLSAAENLNIHLAYMNVSDASVHDTLKLVGLHETSNQPVSNFSLGMRQRLGVARAIIHQPKLLVLDEPMNGLDPIGIRQMRMLLKELAAKEGMTILISSHILSDIEQIANTIGILCDGSLVTETSVTAIKKQYPNGLEEYFFKIVNGGDYE